jgi:DNA-binding GntR family transcriptional regulator
MQLTKVAATHYHTKQEMVYHTLRDAILHGSLGPGQRLVIDEIAQALSISHIPVREALHILQSEGLVETIPHTGVRVSSLSRESITEVFTIMEGLELVASRIAATKMTTEHIEFLTMLLNEMDTAIAAEDYRRWGDLNVQFHRSIAAITEMPLLLEMTDRVLRQWDRVRYHFFSQVMPDRVGPAQADHRKIVQYLQEQQFEQLEAIVKDHNRNALAMYLQHIQ